MRWHVLNRIGKVDFDELKRLIVPVNLLDFDRVRPLVGTKAKARFNELYQIMVNMQKPLYFTGPPGTGKTTYAENLAKKYHEDFGVDAFVAQVSPETTKGQIGIGKQLRNGTLVTVKGMLAVAAEEGQIAIIDEAQQSSQELLATMQSLFERNSNLSDGTEIVYAKETFRVIFCSNSSTSCAANIPLPQACASRFIGIRFDYPPFDEEIDITKEIVQDQTFTKLELIVPDSVVRYLIGLMRANRSDAFPLSARNAASCVAYLNVLAQYNGFKKTPQKKAQKDLADLFRTELGLATQQNLENHLANIYEFVHGKAPTTTIKLTEDEGVKEFLRFYCAYGAEKFVEAVRANFMIDLDIDASFGDLDAQKQKLLAAVPTKSAQSQTP